MSASCHNEIIHQKEIKRKFVRARATASVVNCTKCIASTVLS